MAWQEIEPHARHIRYISDRMKELVRHHGRKKKPFLLVSEDPIMVVTGGAVSTAMDELFSPASIKLARQARDFYLGNEFHPYFDLFLQEVGARGLQSHVTTEVASQNSPGISYFLGGTIYFDEPQKARQYCDAQNASFSRIIEQVQTEAFQKRMQSLSRAARDSRTSLMQYLKNAVDNQPDVCVSQFTLLGSHAEPEHLLGKILEAREKFVRFLTEGLDERYGCLGHILLLRRDLQQDYHLRALVFFRNANVSALQAASSYILSRWQKIIGAAPGDGGYGGPLSPRDSQTDQYALMLDLSTLLTEPDFYVRFQAVGGHRQFWTSERPKEIVKRASPSRRRASADGFADDIKMWQEQFEMAREGYRQLSRAERKALNAPIPDDELPPKFWERKEIAAQTQKGLAEMASAGMERSQIATDDGIPDSPPTPNTAPAERNNQPVENGLTGNETRRVSVEIKRKRIMIKRSES
ncbi:hypothetical protein Q2T91_16495 [Ralstonia pseudosolanacearum]|uniref:hypothetical protein n=1 Tax=Ralstonia pseudosolanacearum TaxID=1310165 RepID=UPI001FFBD710|nr:hypothetical protein [Ralstonia pseudosolanacearum]